MKPYEVLEAELHQLAEENQFLRMRNTDLRQKSWINVYDENLKMIDEIKALKHENEVKFNDLVKYEKTIEQLRKELIQVGQVADKYYKEACDYFKEANELHEENKQLKGVVESVETFCKQYTTR